MTTHPPPDTAPAENIAAAVDRLARAARTRTPCPPVRDLIGADDVAAAYASGVACLGDPLAASVWLARAGAEMGGPLRAGEVVLSGALGPMVAATAGDHFHADLAGLGQVAVHFAAEAHR